MATILIGTSGYSYTEWVGPVYPGGTRPEDYLRLYATMFPTVELNFSYYRMPRSDRLLAMHRQSESLLFSVKAHESLTHTVDPRSWREAAATFRSAVEPLEKVGKLGAVLLQFPQSFHYDPDRRRYLDLLIREFSSFPMAVEFRNAQWYNNRTLDALRERKVALTSLDLPGVKGFPPVMDVATSPLAYIRLHGRNGRTWWGSDASSRYDYLYSDRELEAIAERVRGIAAAAKLVLVYFNNHLRGQAVQNAKMLKAMLSLPGGNP